MIRMKFNYIPPSVNHAYVNKRGGGRIMSREGKEFKARVRADILSNYKKELQTFKAENPYELVITFYLKDMYLKKQVDGVRRYKKIDVTNRIKLLEDALSEVIGVDDKNFIIVVARKCESSTLSNYTTVTFISSKEEPGLVNGARPTIPW